MKIIEIKRTCYRRQRFVSVDGYLDKEEVNEQLLCKEIFLFGLKVQRIIVSVEEIPLWAVIQNACIGGSSWRSKNPEMVNKWANEPIAYVFEIQKDEIKSFISLAHIKKNFLHSLHYFKLNP